MIPRPAPDGLHVAGYNLSPAAYMRAMIRQALLWGGEHGESMLALGWQPFRRHEFHTRQDREEAREYEILSRAHHPTYTFARRRPS